MTDDLDRAHQEGFVERLASALGGLSQAVVAKRARVSTTVMSQYLRGSEPSLFRAARLADVLGVSLRWLATGEGQPNAAASGFFSIPIYDVRLAAGAASFAEVARRIGEMPIDVDLLRQLGRGNADGLAAVEAEGDSMEPLISDGARVIMDLHDTRLREGVFGFRMGDELRVKRLRRLADGVEIMSENPRYEPERLTGDVLDQFAIIGRVRLAVSVI